MFGDSLVFNSKVFVRFCCSEVQKLFAQGRNLRFVFRTLAAIPKSKMRARFSGITYTMHQGGSCNTEVSSGLSRATKWSFKFRKFGRKFGRKVARNEGLLGVAWFRCRARMFKHCFKVCSPNTSRTCFSMFWRFFVLFFLTLTRFFQCESCSDKHLFLFSGTFWSREHGGWRGEVLAGQPICNLLMYHYDSDSLATFRFQLSFCGGQCHRPG